MVEEEQLLRMRSGPNNVISFSNCLMKPTVSMCFIFVLLGCVTGIILLSSFSDLLWFQEKGHFSVPSSFTRKDKFLEVPQISWGLNNQKIAFARAFLIARFLNRTLLMPSLSASLFYKEIDLLQPIWFDKVFQFEQFNARCNGFVRLGRYSDLLNQSKPFELHKGSGRKWTKERDLDQLKYVRDSVVNEHEMIRITGKNPFLWHDHWPVKDYAKIFSCLVLVDEIENEAKRVISKLKETGKRSVSVSYVAVHMRLEKDWLIHCKKLQHKLNISQICSSKEEIVQKVAQIAVGKEPSVVYVAVADSLLEDGSILSGWPSGLIPLEKKKLGVSDIYDKYPYLIQSAIDYEVCLRADVFIGNSFSTFSSLIVLDRTQQMIRMGVAQSCGEGIGLASYAYNVEGENGGPRRWTTDMSSPSLDIISYGTNNVTCSIIAY